VEAGEAPAALVMAYDEASLLATLRAAIPRFDEPLGIGDDAAILDGHVLTTDMLVEDIDFTSAIPIEFVAAKSLAVNLSDLAAMGARPRAFLLSLGLSPSARSQFDRFVAGIAGAAARYEVGLIGGDLSAAEKLIISITAIGTAPERPLLRSGARRGDRLFVSRALGGSVAGLRLLQNGWRISTTGVVTPPAAFDYGVREVATAAMLRHVAPEPECELGPKLATMPEVSACIDISDGLSIDLARLCEASGVGAVIDVERLPPLPGLPETARALGVAVEAAVLHGGEEYALLFTSTLRESELSQRCGRPVFSIGRITERPGVFIDRDGTEEPLEAKGFDHFRA
jgi:thiamine-monophosphate kinase